MTKAILLSVKPKWCSLIFSGEKTVEVRKRQPKVILPTKVYVYETMGVEPLRERGDLRMHGSGMVIGEFVCHEISPFSVPRPAWYKESDWATLRAACLSYEEAYRYLSYHTGYAWLISDAKLYDTAIDISKFKRWNRTEGNAPCAHTKSLYEPCETCTACNMKHAPQSFAYVEELE